MLRLLVKTLILLRDETGSRHRSSEGTKSSGIRQTSRRGNGSVNARRQLVGVNEIDVHLQMSHTIVLGGFKRQSLHTTHINTVLVSHERKLFRVGHFIVAGVSRVVGLQDQSHRVVLADTVTGKHTTNEETLVDSGLQLDDNTDIRAALVLARNTRGHTARGEEEIMSVGDVIGGGRGSGDGAVANHEHSTRQVESASLHHQPRQTKSRGNRRRNSPLLAAETIIGLEQLHIKCDLTSAHDVANTGDGRVALIRGITSNFRKTHKHRSINKGVQYSRNSVPLLITGTDETAFNPNIILFGVSDHIDDVRVTWIDRGFIALSRRCGKAERQPHRQENKRKHS
mmetsp:Transcript_5881/g.11262  ORF Transcript_5881/g.11262 Transcript_5881/m.11262 type:complete len:341 (+) Transcript_5881:531-1553(+)